VVHAERTAAQPGQVGGTHQAVASAVSSITVAGVELPVAEEMKVLGVVLDRRLTFEKHVTMVARSCHYHAQAIRYMRHLLSSELASILAHSLILTRLDYCNSLLHGLHIPAVSRHYSACRTTPLGLFCKHRGSATQTRCCASSTGCRFITESTTSWL